MAFINKRRKPLNYSQIQYPAPETGPVYGDNSGLSGLNQNFGQPGPVQASPSLPSTGLYHYVTRAFAEARISFVTRWFWLAEIVTLGFLAIFGLIDILFWINGHYILGFFTLFLVGFSFLTWRLARYLRQLVYRKINRALASFDDLLGRGAAQVSDWPRFYRNFRQGRRSAF